MNRILEKTINLLVNQKWHLLTAILITALAGGLFLKNLKIDNSLEVWFVNDDPTLVNYNEFKKIYGNDEIVAALITPKTNLYDKKFVEKIYNASIKMDKHPLIKRVISISKTPYIDGANGRLTIEDMVKENPNKTYDAESLKKRLKSNPQWDKLLFNKNSKSTMIIIEPVTTKDMDTKRPEILNFIKQSLSGLNYRLAGMGVAYDEINKISLKESPLFTMIAYLLLILLLFLFFRKFSIFVASTLTMIISTVLFLEISGLFNQSINMIYAILPTVIIILSLSDIIHVFTHYDKTPIGENRLKRNLRYVVAPCLLTSLTTAAGFMALVSSPMKVLKNFGIFASVGVMIAFIVAMAISALVLSVIEIKNSKKEPTEENKQKTNTNNKIDFFDKVLRLVNNLTKNQHKKILVFGTLLIILGIVGITQLKVDTYSMNFLLDSNKVKQDSKFIEKDYGYYLPLEIRLKPKNDDGVKDPLFLKRLSKLQKSLDKKSHFENSTSIGDVIKHLNRVLTDNKKSSYKIPDNKNAIAQELLLYEMNEDNDLSFFVEEEYEETRLTVRIPMVSSKNMRLIMKEAKVEIKKYFNNSVDITYGGYIPLYVKMMEYIIESQISSFLIAFLIIFLIIGLIFRSVSIVIIGIIPNLLPIFLTLGFMGLFNINLDIATVTIAAIAIGISVDDTIHFIFMYIKKRKEGLSTSQAVEETIFSTGKAIIITSLLLILGYSVLIFASIKSVIFFGLLIAVAMLFAVISDLILLPSLLLFFSKDK